MLILIYPLNNRMNYLEDYFEPDYYPANQNNISGLLEIDSDNRYYVTITFSQIIKVICNNQFFRSF